MNNKHIILLITVVIIAVVVYIYNKREDFIGTFGNFGNQLTYRGQGVWKDAKVVRIITFSGNRDKKGFKHSGLLD